MNKQRGQNGFTLIELMIVVAIIGILASVAIPSFIRYIRHAKTIEATMNIRKLYDSSVAYFNAEHADASGNITEHQFPATATWTPTLNTCCLTPAQKCSPNPALWKTPVWMNLNFSVDDPHYYQYSAERMPNGSFGSAIGDQYWLQATGNLDCDLIPSLFVRQVTIMAGKTLMGSSGLYTVNENE